MCENDHGGDSPGTCTADETPWDPSTPAAAPYRNQVWWIMGRSRKRDVALTVCELAAEPMALAQVDIATAAAKKPHFADKEGKPDLSDNGDLEPLKEILSLVAVPRFSRPEFEFVYPFKPVCEYMLNPYHEPTNPEVQAAIDYAVTNQALHEESGRGGTDALPIDPFSAEAYVYIQLHELIRCETPKVRFERFRPNDFGAGNSEGFEICGSLSADELALEEDATDSQLKQALGNTATELTEIAGANMAHHQMGLYEAKEDETHRELRQRSIQDHATFDVFDIDLQKGLIEFEWHVEPVLVQA